MFSFRLFLIAPHIPGCYSQPASRVLPTPALIWRKPGPRLSAMLGATILWNRQEKVEEARSTELGTFLCWSRTVKVNVL